MIRVASSVLAIMMFAGFGNAAVIHNSFVGQGYGAHVKAMGGAVCALSGRADYLYCNPASNASIERLSVVSSYSSFYDGSFSQVSLTVAAPLGSMGVLSAAVPGLQVTNIPETTDDPFQNRFVQNGSVCESRVAGLLSWSVQFFPLSIGITGKYIRQNIASEEAYGVGYDAGALLQFTGSDTDLRIGVSITDIGDTLLRWSTGSTDHFPMKTTVGASVEKALGSWHATVAADIVSAGEEQYSSYGIEARYSQLAFMVGLDGRLKDPELSYGIAIDLGGMELDYATWNDENLGITHKVSITIQL